MFSVALLSLMLPIATPAPVANPVPMGATRAGAADPAIRVSLDRRDYEPGDEARVTVTVRDDGYLLVLRLSPDGYVRVLFPLDPGDDYFVRGNGSYEIRGRGDRNAFTVSSGSGTGTVYAAWSTEPFRFDDYVLGDHWDYRTLDGSQMQGDPEAALTELAQRMSTGRFVYDLTSYSVARQVAYTGTTHYVTMYPAPYPYTYPAGCYYTGWCGSGSFVSVSIGFGWGRARAAWYDPYYHDPFYYGPYYWPRPYYGYRVSYPCYGCGYRYPRVIVVNRPVYRGSYPYQWKPGSGGGGGGVTGVQYRPRAAYASAPRQQVSPLYQASSYRRVADHAVARSSAAQAVRRQPTTVFGAPLTSGSSTPLGTPRRTPGQVEAQGGAVRRGATAPRRAGEANPSGTAGLRSDDGSRVSPRVVDGVGSGNAVGQGRSGIAEPRRAEPPVGAGRTAPERGVRAEPRRVERAEPVQRAEPRPAPRAPEPRSAPAPRASEPRSAPAPRVSQPRSSQPRSAAAPRGRRP